MTSKTQHFKLLKSNKAKIAIWGCGYIGYSTMCFYAKNNIKSFGYDIDIQKVKEINKGKINIYGLKNWLGFNINKKKQKKFIKASNNIKEIINDKDVICHFVCIPTEKNGKPYLNYFREILKLISKRKSNNFKIKECIIVESTLMPNTVDKLFKDYLKKYKIFDNFHFAVAPRRDWFEDQTKTLETLDRVFGCKDKSSNKIIFQILSIVTKKVHIATNHRVSELVKSVENCYRHVEINLANELSLAYPEKDMREVLSLVGTKWNMNTYYPGFGTGGYCIPLSSKYILGGSNYPKKLKIVNEAVKLDSKINKIIGRSVLKNNIKKILILGLSYKSNLKVHILSPTIDLVNYFKKKSISVTLYDPLFSSFEIKKILNVKSLNKLNSFRAYHAIIIMVKHNQFYDINFKKISSNSNLKLILDNANFFKNKPNFLPKNAIYKKTGQSNWLS